MAIHDLTFTGWGNYTDGDGNAFTLDWSSSANMRGNRLFPYVDAIRQAVNEKVGISTSAYAAYDLTGHAETEERMSTRWYTAQLDSPPMYAKWAEAVLKQAIIYLWYDPQFVLDKARGQWVKRGAVSTVNNLGTDWLEDSFDDGDLYIGAVARTLAGSEAEYYSILDSVHEGMLADADIVAADTLAWWRALPEIGYATYPATDYIGALDNILFVLPSSELFLSIKDLLDVLVEYVDSRALMSYYPVLSNDMHTTKITAEAFREGTAFEDPIMIVPTAIPIADVEAVKDDAFSDFSGSSWVEGSYSAGSGWTYPSSPSHYFYVYLFAGVMMEMAVEDTGGRDNPRPVEITANCIRGRKTFSIKMTGDVSRDVEVAWLIDLERGSPDNLRPQFQTQDFPTITGDKAYASMRSSETAGEGWVEYNFGNFGTMPLNSLYKPHVYYEYPIDDGGTLVNTNPAPYGWSNVKYPTMLVKQDFDVSGGFIFR